MVGVFVCFFLMHWLDSTISKVPYVMLTFWSTASSQTLDKCLLSFSVAEFDSNHPQRYGNVQRCHIHTLHVSTYSLCFSDTLAVQTITLFSAENFLFMTFIKFGLTIYKRYILSSGNSRSLTAIRSMWFKVLWKDFQALTCTLLSVNILFHCPSLSCSIC